MSERDDFLFFWVNLIYFYFYYKKEKYKNDEWGFHLCLVVYVGYIQNVGIKGQPRNLICFYRDCVCKRERERETVYERESMLLTRRTQFSKYLFFSRFQ